MTSPAPSPPPRFDPSKPHQQRPKIRPVRGFAAQAKGPDGNTIPLLGLADARQISDKVVFTMPAAQVIVPLLDGTRTLDQIVAEVGRGLTRDMLEQFVAQLDDAVLLEGPVFDALSAKARAAFDSLGVLPPASTAAFTDAVVAHTHKDAPEEERRRLAASLTRQALDKWIDAALKSAENPALDALPKAIVVPHLDYPRGWPNYAAVYGRLRVCDRPDRVVILGTNHFGSSTGVCGCDKGYQTTLGTCDLDDALATKLRAALGDSLFENRFDHENEHSIELQVMWVQHVFGDAGGGGFPRVFGALVHDPSVNNGESYDGKGVALQPFVDALKSALGDLPGRTLIVSSADLSHVGPAFGDPHPLAGESEEAVQARNRMVHHDQEMLQLYAQNKPWEMIASMAWQQNPTRWCSLGSMVAALLVTEPAKVDILNYAAAMDPQGTTVVSSAAMVLS